MRALFCVGLAAAFTAPLFASPAHAQGAPSEALVQRVDSLQTRVEEIERQVAELEKLLKATSARRPAAAAAPNPQDIANWRRLREEMSIDDVRSLLGEPEKIDDGSVAFWYYPRGGRVTFISGRLSSWSEPSR